jgi:RsiW-degrading membrane proteinase PrsW (M82 family)
MPAGAHVAARSVHYLTAAGVGCLALILGFVILALLLWEVPLVAVIVGGIAAVLPVPIYAFLIISLDRYEKEPTWLLVGAFFWGAIVASVFSLVMNTVIGAVFAILLGPEWAQVLTPPLVAPFVEETSKGFALLLILLFLSYDFDDVLDGIIYGALVGLGFAMTENILYFARAFAVGGLVGVGGTFYVRVILGGFLHSLFTGVTGAGVGVARETRSPILKWIAPVLGYFAAMFLHFLWNTASLLIGVAMADHPVVHLLIVLPFQWFILILPGLITLLAIAFFAWRREARIISEQLREEVERGVVRPGEYDVLAGGFERTKRVWQTLFRFGPVAWNALRHLYDLEAELAFRKWHTSLGERLPASRRYLSAESYRERIAAMREHLQAMGIPTS